MRITNPLEPTQTIAKKIVCEITLLWNRARIPTISEKLCPQNQRENRPMASCTQPFRLRPPARKPQRSSRPCPKDERQGLRGNWAGASPGSHEVGLMKRWKTEGAGDKYDWQVDYEFYLDQCNVPIISHSHCKFPLCMQFLSHYE